MVYPVGGLEHVVIFHFIYGILWNNPNPIDELHHFSRLLKHVKTTKQYIRSMIPIQPMG